MNSIRKFLYFNSIEFPSSTKRNLMNISLMIIDDDLVHHKLIHIVVANAKANIKYQCYLQASDAYSYILDNNHKRLLPNLILLDLNMPLISGWGFLELFEAINPLLEKQIDVIILTSSVNPADKERASNYKCVKGFFNKPFTEAMLKDILSSSFISLKK